MNCDSWRYGGKKTMPTYTFECEKCKKRFEQEMTIAEYERAAISCPKCKEKKVKRVYEPFLAQTKKKS
jgi:putative FmdB family regulatory protein